jgi:hypothetical protein
MTIAIGMLYNEGVLMCADSLVTSGTLGSYQSKILGYRIDGADVIFALAGNVELAESAWQLCGQELVKKAGTKQTSQQIANSLRPILAKEYQENVFGPGWTHDNDYKFVIAIRPDGAKTDLFHTYAKTLRKSRKGGECIGAGDDLARFLLTWVRHASLPADKLADAAAYIVGTLKAQMPGVIGGSNLIMKLSDEGDLQFYRRSDLQLIEQYGPTFDIESYNLLWKFLDTTVEESKFAEEIDGYSKRMSYWRKQYKEKHGGIIWSAIPSVAEDAIIDLRTKAQ